MSIQVGSIVRYDSDHFPELRWQEAKVIRVGSLFECTIEYPDGRRFEVSTEQLRLVLDSSGNALDQIRNEYRVIRERLTAALKKAEEGATEGTSLGWLEDVRDALNEADRFIPALRALPEEHRQYVEPLIEVVEGLLRISRLFP